MREGEVEVLLSIHEQRVWKAKKKKKDRVNQIFSSKNERENVILKIYIYNGIIKCNACSN